MHEKIHGLILKKQTISLIEREMERFLEQREKISRKHNRLVNRLNRKTEIMLLLKNSPPSALNMSENKIDELKDRIDVMKSNIDYLQDQIAECQTNIIQLDEMKVNIEGLI